MESTPDLQEFVRNIIAGHQKYGDQLFDEISQRLAEKRAPGKEIENKIFEEVSIIYRVPVRMIKVSNKRGKVTHAKISAIILLYRHAGLKQKAIADIFTRDKSLISHRIKAYESGNETEKFCSDKLFQKKMRHLDASIKKFKESLLSN